MKSLKQYLNESLVNEAYSPKFKPNDWEKVLKDFKAPASNYSQLGGLENLPDDNTDYAIEEWIDIMIDGGVKDTPENREILSDIAHWVIDNYEQTMFGWGDDAESIVEIINNMDSTEWGVSAEDYVEFMRPKKRLTGTNKKYGEVLSTKGDSEYLREIASQYSDNW